MSHLIVNHNTVTLDKNGFLKDRSQWNEAVAKAIAIQENMELTEQHWQLIYFLRHFYKRYEFIPPLRAFIKSVKNECDPALANSITLHKLFPGSPIKYLSKIAGLPKPSHCM